MNTSSISIGDNFQELTVHGKREFPIQYYVDDFFRFPGCRFPLHWHAEAELLLVCGGPVQAQIGRMEFLLDEGDGIFVNSNVLHSFSQLYERDRCRCPNILFSGELIAPADHLIYRKYIGPLLSSRQLPCIVLKPAVLWQKQLLSHLDHIFSLLQKYGSEPEHGPLPFLPFEHAEEDSPCFEMQVQNELNHIWQLLFSHAGELSSVKPEKEEAVLQIRMQKMLAFIRSSYANSITLNDIAASAGTSKSEASRCFQSYLHQPPVGYLQDYRLERAKQLLSSSPDTVEEISRKCGFQSSGYFCRVFRKHTGLSPNQYRMHSRQLRIPSSAPAASAGNKQPGGTDLRSKN